jgi:hypothetical protein
MNQAMMRLLIGAVAACAIITGAHAQNCGNGNGNNGQGQGGFNVGGNCVASQNDLNTLNNQFTALDQQVTATNQTFSNRFNDIQSQITNNRLEARRGVAMAMAAGGLGAGAGAVAAGGAGKAALSAGVGEFQGQWSFAAGISYAVNKRLLLNAGTTVAPFTPAPSVGFSAGATLVLN